MKTVETIKTGKNFTAVSVGKLNEIKDYVLPMGDIEISWQGIRRSGIAGNRQ